MQADGLTAYELLRLENIAHNQRYLEELGLGSTKNVKSTGDDEEELSFDDNDVDKEETKDDGAFDVDELKVLDEWIDEWIENMDIVSNNVELDEPRTVPDLPPLADWVLLDTTHSEKSHTVILI